ncbi:hypothetical protein LAWI1_G004224 [Lachnellula willkommii]|uniref:Uncharacterized protein n=1 Tax=Lachnellula willkommii TaxID=215461 RepID=A0A559MJI5_9HELO|nr:hypothetical protein LAWI1_G004224 [Lachnellula willkommii]
MASLGLVERATVFDGALVLKSYCSMFVPTKRIKDSIQWHFVRNAVGYRVSYLVADKVCPERLKIDCVDIDCLEYVRNFVGWVSSAALRTGTENIKYKNINWTGSNFSFAGCAFEKVSISGGKFSK